MRRILLAAIATGIAFSAPAHAEDVSNHSKCKQFLASVNDMDLLRRYTTVLKTDFILSMHKMQKMQAAMTIAYCADNPDATIRDAVDYVLKNDDSE